MTTLKTERLILRPWTMDDVGAAFRMYGDPEVTRYLGNSSFEPSLESQAMNLEKVIEKYKVLGKEGFGFWAAEERETGEVVGAGLLKPLVLSEGHSPKDYPEIEVGWHVAQTHWSRGIATEIGRELVRHGFETVGLPEILAVAFPENAKSTRVMDKLGMTFIGATNRYYDLEVVAYRITP